ncbi:MAG TPA: PLP-dependent aminotransferase family protein, partial [Longimicrobiaceae bacterium]|nr:PLP-dependent aminotransferase family protein [Longimicrobiaceae bacterium]
MPLPPPLIPSPPAPRMPFASELPLAAWTRALRPSVIQAMMGHMARPRVISFALGLPASELFPVDAYLAAAERVLRADRGALQYRAPYAPLKEQIAALMRRRGVECRPEQVFLTTGAQQALALLARLFLEPGGAVICDRRVYMGFQQVVESYRPRILPVDSDLETGMDVDQVQAHLERGPRPAFIYCISDGHNPLGVSVSPEKRPRLAELARAHGVPLIEDDAYGLLHYGDPLPALRALDERWVIYVGSFSKVMAPGFRVGWAVVPDELVEMLGCAKDGLDVDTSTFAQRLVSEYLEAGTFETHLAAIREAYTARRDAMLLALAREFPAGTRWSVPRHGALLWAELPRGLDAGALLPRALEREGVAFVPGNAFTFDGKGARGGMRLNFSHPTVAEIEEGMARLGRLCREAAA